MAAFRSNEVGADTEGYRLSYESLSQYSTLQSLIDRYTIYYIGYYGTSKIFNLLGMPVQVWFGFVEGLYLFSLMKLINKYSMDKIFSLLIFTTIGLFTFSLAGLKQTFSMSLMMLSFIYYVDKKYLISILFIYFTYYTHQSSLIFLAAYPLYHIRRNKFFIPLTIVFSILIYSYSFLFMETMVKILDNEKWETYLVTDSQYTYVTFIFYFIITLIASFNFKCYKSAEPNNAIFFLGLSILGCGLQLLAGVSPSLFRLAYLYTPFMMILLPNSIYFIKSPNKKNLFRFTLMGCIIFYFLYTNRHWPYSFI